MSDLLNALTVKCVKPMQDGEIELYLRADSFFLLGNLLLLLGSFHLQWPALYTVLISTGHN